MRCPISRSSATAARIVDGNVRRLSVSGCNVAVQDRIRFFRLLGSSQGRGQIAFQLDPELAVIEIKTIKSISPRSISEGLASYKGFTCRIRMSPLKTFAFSCLDDERERSRVVAGIASTTPQGSVTSTQISLNSSHRCVMVNQRREELTIVDDGKGFTVGPGTRRARCRITRSKYPVRPKARSTELRNAHTARQVRPRRC